MGMAFRIFEKKNKKMMKRGFGRFFGFFGLLTKLLGIFLRIFFMLVFFFEKEEKGFLKAFMIFYRLSVI
jgi:hypothetical protein